MRILLSAAAVSAGLMLSGCVGDNAVDEAQYQPVSGTPASMETTNAVPDVKLIVTAMEGLDGRVSFVNSNLRFVVLTFPLGQMPAINQQLNVYRDGLKVGILNVSGPQIDDTIVADIIMGEAQKDDQVRDR